MTIAQPFLVSRPEQRDGPWRVIAGGEQTGGSLVVGDAQLPPHTPGPGRHVHTREDEGIYVVAGVLTVEVGDQRFEAGPESFVWLPRRVPHVFANLSDQPVWTVGTITPAGLEEMFAERDEYLASLGGPPDQAVLLAMNERYGVFPVEGPPLA
jgi:mannose-6-phosphate isomerase-like protein (cupin superfamily)